EEAWTQDLLTTKPKTARCADLTQAWFPVIVVEQQLLRSHTCPSTQSQARKQRFTDDDSRSHGLLSQPSACGEIIPCQANPTHNNRHVTRLRRCPDGITRLYSNYLSRGIQGGQLRQHKGTPQAIVTQIRADHAHRMRCG